MGREFGVHGIMAAFQDCECPFLFRTIGRIVIGGKEQRLGQVRIVGDAAPHHTARLVFQCCQGLAAEAFACEGEETHPETPDIVFLGGTVDLACNDVLMKGSEMTEGRLPGDPVPENQAEIGIISCREYGLCRLQRLFLLPR